MHLCCFDFSTYVTNVSIDVLTATGTVGFLKHQNYCPELTNPTLISKSGLLSK